MPYAHKRDGEALEVLPLTLPAVLAPIGIIIPGICARLPLPRPPMVALLFFILTLLVCLLCNTIYGLRPLGDLLLDSPGIVRLGI